MAASSVAGLTQETYDAIAAEMLIKSDDEFVILNNTVPMSPQTIDRGSKTVNFNQPDLPSGVYTEASRRLTENTAITTARKAITLSQKTLTFYEYGGPDVSGVITPFGITSKLQAMAKHDLIPLIGEFMRRDRNKWLNTVRRNDLLSTTLVVTADATAEGAIAEGQAFNANMLSRMNKAMKDNLVRPFPNGRWKLFITTQQENELKADEKVQRAFDQWAIANPIITSGQIGFYEGFDIFVDTLMPTKAVGAGSLVTAQQCIAIGPLHLGHAIIDPPSVREGDDTDFKRQLSLVWVSIEALGLLYGDYVVRGIST